MLQQRNEILENIRKRLRSTSDSIWVSYGSFAISGSAYNDIDMMCITPGVDELSRVSEAHNGTKVTVYLLSWETFEMDGLAGRFGGFFVGKLIGPYTLNSSNTEARRLIERTQGQFFHGLISPKITPTKIYSPQALCALGILEFISIYPEYGYYFAKLWTSENFEGIWQTMVEQCARGLVSNGWVDTFANGERSLKPGAVLPDTYKIEERHAYAARFWAVATYLHQCDYNFPDIYREGAIKKILDSSALNKAHQFLLTLTGT